MPTLFHRDKDPHSHHQCCHGLNFNDAITNPIRRGRPVVARY